MNDPRHQKRMAQCRSYACLFGIGLVVLVCLGVLGCRTSNQEARQLLPMPQQFSSSSAHSVTHSAMIAPQPTVKTATWRWVYPPGHKLAWWDTSTDLKTWEFGGWTTNDYATFQLTNKAQFFVFYSLPWSNSLRIGIGKPQPPDFWKP